MFNFTLFFFLFVRYDSIVILHQIASNFVPIQVIDLKKKTLQRLLIGTASCLILILGFQLYRDYLPALKLLLDPDLNKKRLMHAVDAHGVSTSFLLIGLTAVMCILPGMPASAVGVLSGISYGPYVGCLINFAGNAAGNFISIYLYKKFNLFQSSTSSKRNKWFNFLSKVKYPRFEMMFLYMVPVIPSSLVNFAVYLFDYDWQDIYWVVLFGVIPTSLLYAFGGHILLAGKYHLSKPLIAALALILFLVLLFSLIKNKKSSSHHD